MNITFNNVTITLTAKNPTEAYTQLCNTLATMKDSDWTTDTYSLEDGEEHDTSELLPNDEKDDDALLEEQIENPAHDGYVPEGASETAYENHYMHCGVKWSSAWSCMCNDECPKCHGEIEPYKSEETNGETVYHVGTNWIPEGGWPEGCSSRED